MKVYIRQSIQFYDKTANFSVSLTEGRRVCFFIKQILEDLFFSN